LAPLERLRRSVKRRRPPQLGALSLDPSADGPDRAAAGVLELAGVVGGVIEGVRAVFRIVGVLLRPVGISVRIVRLPLEPAGEAIEGVGAPLEVVGGDLEPVGGPSCRFLTRLQGVRGSSAGAWR
jgi:hypothetical protein